MNETVANGEFDLTKLFEEDDAAISAPDPLVSRGAQRWCSFFCTVIVYPIQKRFVQISCVVIM
jgi:hypothetical protein